MSEEPALITDEEFDKILEIVEVFDKSSFDYLTLELSDLKLTVGTGNAPSDSLTSTPHAPLDGERTDLARKPEPKTVDIQPDQADLPVAVESTEPPKGSVAVQATTMGSFFSCPDPASPPFVEIGTDVKAEDTVGLIEIMKVFSNVSAGIAGVVTEICVGDGELVEYGQVVMYILPAEQAEDRQ